MLEQATKYITNAPQKQTLLLKINLKKNRFYVFFSEVFTKIRLTCNRMKIAILLEAQIKLQKYSKLL